MIVDPYARFVAEHRHALKMLADFVIFVVLLVVGIILLELAMQARRPK